MLFGHEASWSCFVDKKIFAWISISEIMTVWMILCRVKSSLKRLTFPFSYKETNKKYQWRHCNRQHHHFEEFSAKGQRLHFVQFTLCPLDVGRALSIPSWSLLAQHCTSFSLLNARPMSNLALSQGGRSNNGRTNIGLVCLRCESRCAQIHRRLIVSACTAFIVSLSQFAVKKPECDGCVGGRFSKETLRRPTHYFTSRCNIALRCFQSVLPSSTWTFQQRERQSVGAALTLSPTASKSS